MKIFSVLLLMVGFLASPLCADQEPFTQLTDADVLPLALTDNYRIKKAIAETFTRETRNDGTFIPNRMLAFKQEQKLRGAIGSIEEYQRYGQHFTFYWHAKEEADVRIRLEYHQAKLGDYVLAREVAYPAARGNFKTNFQITGEDFYRDGHVTSWRVLLIRDDRIVAMKTSALWN